MHGQLPGRARDSLQRAGDPAVPGFGVIIIFRRGLGTSRRFPPAMVSVLGFLDNAGDLDRIALTPGAASD
jgi:hypothetical protein